MNTRIRYNKTDNPSIFISTRIFYAGVNSYRVRINTDDLSFVILDAIADVSVKTGSAKTASTLKKDIKKAMIDLGVDFGSENRNR
jgi:hypothetical protein